MERTTGIEPATLALARRCSTAEPLPQNMVRVKGLEPPRRETPDPKSGASAIPPHAHNNNKVSHEGLEPSTP